ncbi:hypothetical protein M2271_004989 [Streptomyces sp. LBL]|nr:hypothetical protein [Streptomyces sp. LBL]
MSCGTRAQDFRPGDPDGVRLLRSSLGDQLLSNGVLRTAGIAHCCEANCSVTCGSATLRQPAPSPILRLPWLGTPLPNLPMRAPAADAFTEVPLTDFTAGYCELHLRVLPLRYCSRRPLITAGHPVRSSVPSPSCKRSGFGTPPPHRPAHCNCVYCCPAVRFCQGPLISATRETITTSRPDVYSDQHRFSRVGRRGNRPLTAMEGDRSEAVTAGSTDRERDTSRAQAGRRQGAGRAQASAQAGPGVGDAKGSGGGRLAPKAAPSAR